MELITLDLKDGKGKVDVVAESFEHAERIHSFMRWAYETSRLLDAMNDKAEGK